MKRIEPVSFTIPVNANIIEVIVGGDKTIDSACYAYKQYIENDNLVIRNKVQWYQAKQVMIRKFTLMKIREPWDYTVKDGKTYSLSVYMTHSYTLDKIRDGEPFLVIYNVNFMKYGVENSYMERYVWIRNIKDPKLIHVYDNGTFPPVVKVYSVTNPSMIANVKRDDRPIILNHEEEMNGLELINPSEEK